MTVIRGRVPADLPACVSVLRAVHGSAGYPMHWPADPDAWLTPAGLGQAWVAVDGPAVTGHALLTRDGELSRLFVRPDQGRRGVARALIARARAAHGAPLTLEVANDAAAAYYEHTGWTLIGAGPADWTAPDGSLVLLRRYRSAC